VSRVRQASDKRDANKTTRAVYPKREGEIQMDEKAKLTIISGAGSYVYDDGYKEYLDFTSGGIFACAFGIQDPGILQVLAETQPYATYGAHYDSPPAIRLKAMLKELTGYESVVLFSTGAEATEAYWRCMRVYTGKPNIWGGLVDPDKCGDAPGTPDSMHGVTLGALIMSGRMGWPGMDPAGAFQGRFAQDPDSTCCAIWEPYHAPSAQFHKVDPTINRLKTLIDMYPNIPHCSDEVQGGMGRTGKLFGYQWYDGLKPKFVILGKMLGGGLPLSALLGPKEILEDELVVENAHLHSTHSGNPLMAAVGCYVIERIQTEGLIDESYRKGLLLAEGLKGLGVRVHAGRGLLAGLEMEGPLEASKVVLKCRDRGLLVVDTGRKWVKIGPQLNITDEQIADGCSKLRAAIEEVQSETEAQRDTGEKSGEGGEPVREAGVEAVEVGGNASGAKDEG
jgi:acetylornithine/N-succinyldiaminopimelate aminotransferase